MVDVEGVMRPSNMSLTALSVLALTAAKDQSEVGPSPPPLIYVFIQLL